MGKKSEKETKNILVYFGDSEEDQILRERLKKRCKYYSEGSFMKEAAEEKLNREEYFNSLMYNQQPINTTSPVIQQNTEDDYSTLPDFDVDNFTGSIE